MPKPEMGSEYHIYELLDALKNGIMAKEECNIYLYV